METIVMEAEQCPKCGRLMAPGMLAGLCAACLLAQGAETDGGEGGSNVPFEPPPLAEIARLFPQLEIIGLLGAGGMGAVYKARQLGEVDTSTVRGGENLQRHESVKGRT